MKSVGQSIPRRAWLYIGVTLLIATLASVYALASVTDISNAQFATWAVLTCLASCTLVFKTLIRQKQSSGGAPPFSSLHLVFMFAGVLLLPAALFVLLVAVSLLIDAARERLLKTPSVTPWYAAAFNFGAHTITGLSVGWLYTYLLAQLDLEHALSSIIAIVTAAFVYAIINHALVGLAVMLEQHISWRETGLTDPEHALPELLMLSIGGAVAKLWQLDPWLVLLVVPALTLVQRALEVPQLRREAQTDPKTSLLNARRFTELASSELERARRFERPVAVIMADLDFLRSVNNNYGHLAGDVVLTGIGQIIARTVREYDIAGRFGGEEFAILLPEVGQETAQAFAERLRQAVEGASFTISTSPEPIRVTMSLGVSCFPRDGANLDQLVHEADVAVYQAKIRGRNQVVCSAEVPHYVRLDDLPPVEYSAATKSGLLQTEGALSNRIPAPSRPIVQPDKVASQQTAAPHKPPIDYAHDSADAKPPAQAPTAAPPEPEASAPKKSYPPGPLGLYIGLVIAAGFLATLTSILVGWHADPVVLLVLLGLAITVEVLQSNYGDGTISVGVAVSFAAALLAGIPGVALVSLIGPLVHFVRSKPGVHVPAFNWALHVLAGCAPVLLVKGSGIPLEAPDLLLLVAPTTLAGTLYFLLETGFIAGAISLSSGASLLKIWREQFQWALGHYLVLCFMGLLLAVSYAQVQVLGVVVFAAPVMMMRYAQEQYVARTKASMQELKRLNGELSQANSEVVAASAAIRKLNDELFLTLAKILDARDPYVSNHSTQVAKYAVAIASEMGLPPERVELCRQAGFLHDIGKIAISEQILHKPGKLTIEEYDILKAHASIGAELLETSQGLRHLAPFVRGHHEQWDGLGYPDHLMREQIPLEARILAVCDSVEAMASDRPYKKAKSLDEIITEVRRCSGSQFDPQVAALFIQVAEREGTKLVVNSALAVVNKQRVVPQAPELIEPILASPLPQKVTAA